MAQAGKNQRQEVRLNYYPHHIGDFNNATRHLTRVERSLYRELIELYYDTEQPLPADDFEWICRKVLVSGQQDRDAVKGILNEFFKLDNDLYHHARCDREIASYRAKQEGAIKAGKASAESRLNKKAASVKRTSNGRSTIVQPTNNHKPRTKNQEPSIEEVALRLPEWLPAEEWKALLEVRKSKKAVNTPRALTLLLTELTRLKSLGFDPARVLDQSTLKGWKSVYAIKPELVSVTAEPVAKLCDYCTKVSTGTVNGRRACDEHFNRAMGNERPAKVAA